MKRAKRTAADSKPLKESAGGGEWTKEGALQIAIAIASLSRKVKVDARSRPPRVDPPDLWNRRLDDADIHITDAHMPAFRAHLAALLPGISGEMDKFPDRANVKVSRIAGLVADALKTAAGGPRKRRSVRRGVRAESTGAGITILTRGATARARETVKNNFGHEFATKATDDLLLAMAPARGFALAARATAREAVAGKPRRWRAAGGQRARVFGAPRKLSVPLPKSTKSRQRTCCGKRK
jgi:hypothetical protein